MTKADLHINQIVAATRRRKRARSPRTTAPVRVAETEEPLSDRVEPSCDWLGLRWYALRTNIKCEQRATMGLRAKGYEVFAPTQRKWVRHRRVGGLARKWKQTEKPLFIRYIFIGFIPGDIHWGSIRDTDGIESVVCVDTRPIPISPAEIVRIHGLVSQGEYDEDTRPRRRKNNLNEGDRVTISSGAFAGQEGIVARKPKETAEEVLIQLLQSALKATVGVDELLASA